MTPPTTQLRAAVKAGLVDILTPAGDWTIKDGRLHDSLGSGYQVAGVSPEDDGVWSRNAFVLEPTILVQVFLKWDKVVDNERVIDPAPIENLADRFRAELQTRQSTNTEKLWYLAVERLWYPNDPVGQKTRFHAHVRGRGENNAILQETGP